MKAHPGIDITEWNYFDAESSVTTVRTTKTNLAQISHAAMAQYSKSITSKSDGQILSGGNSSKDYDKEWKELSNQNDKFHEKINKLNRTVNTLSKNMERLTKKIDSNQNSRTSSAKFSFTNLWVVNVHFV